VMIGDRYSPVYALTAQRRRRAEKKRPQRTG